MHHQKEAVHTIVLTTAEILGPLCTVLREPGLFPVALQRLNLLDEHVSETVKSTVFAALAVTIVVLVVFCHKPSYCCLTHSFSSETRQLMSSLSL